MYPVAFDSHGVRSAYAGAVRSFVRLSCALQPEDWAKPGLEDWTVRELVGHTSRALTTVRDYLEKGEGKPIELQHAFDYFPAVTRLVGAAAPSSLLQRAREAADAMGDDPARYVEQLARHVLARVGATPDAAPLLTLAGGMRLIDYLPTRVLELVVHGADIARATGQSYQPDPKASLIAWTVGGAIAALSADPMPGLLALTGRGPLPEGFSVVP